MASASGANTVYFQFRLLGFYAVLLPPTTVIRLTGVIVLFELQIYRFIISYEGYEDYEGYESYEDYESYERYEGYEGY